MGRSNEDKTMTKATMKKTLKAWMKNYNVTMEDAATIANKNHPALSAVIASAEMDLMVEGLLNAAGI